MSCRGATLYVNKGSAYVVGDLVAIQRLRPHLELLFSVCSEICKNSCKQTLEGHLKPAQLSLHSSCSFDSYELQHTSSH